MRIINLEIKNLYGSMNKHIDFKEELNLLVGINGSGKTSILNVIDWLFRPNLAHLSTVKFDLLKLTFEHNNETLSIEATQRQKKLILNVHGFKDGELEPIVVNLIIEPEYINHNSNIEELHLRYNSLGPDEGEIPLWNYIKEIPKPVVISLDRTITAEADDMIYYEDEPRQRIKMRNKNSNPLEKVREVTTIRYSKYRSKLIELNDVLKSRIIMSALSDPAAKSKYGKSKSKITSEEETFARTS